MHVDHEVEGAELSAPVQLRRALRAQAINVVINLKSTLACNTRERSISPQLGRAFDDDAEVVSVPSDKSATEPQHHHGGMI
jgi:hypothetical protein